MRCMEHRCKRKPVVEDSLRRTYCSECAIKVLKQKVRDLIAPNKDLGHIDK